MSPSERIDALVAGEPPRADEQRLARLIYELQATRPAAPEPLRARVDALAAAEPTRRPTLLQRLSFRRGLLVLAPAVVVLALGAAAVRGIVSSTSPAEQSAKPQSSQSAREPSSERGAGAMTEAGKAPPAADSELRNSNESQGLRARAPRVFPSTSPGRAQDYHADLRLRVDDLATLSERTQAALRLTRSYGGYVVATNYENPRADEGEARLELRVPVGRVQQALVELSELGAIVSQNVSIRDLQGQIDRYTRDVRRLRDRMATLRESLLDPNLTARERTRIEAELAEARSRVAALEQERRLLVRQGRFAKITLGLTTAQPASRGESPGRIERALQDAGALLAKEVAFGLYALIVASPFLLLAALAVVAARAGRRRADQRLLERA